MLLVGLTGGIASGKSVIASVFERRGAFLHRADEEAHRLMAPGRPAWKAVAARFGEGILAPDGTIDRRALGRIVFADRASRRELESIIHPLVIAAMREEVERQAAEGRFEIFVSEAALIFEAGLSGFFDRIVVAYCRPEIQTGRLMERDGITREDALRRISAQQAAGEKRTLADYVIDTSDALEDTLARAEAVWAYLLQDAGRIGPKQT